MVSAVNVHEKPRLIVVAGPNGAGKTSITERLLMHQWMSGCVYINPDLIARDEFGDWNCQDSVLKAAQRAEAIREDCILSRCKVKKITHYLIITINK